MLRVLGTVKNDTSPQGLTDGNWTKCFRTHISSKLDLISIENISVFTQIRKSQKNTTKK